MLMFHQPMPRMVQQPAVTAGYKPDLLFKTADEVLSGVKASLCDSSVVTPEAKAKTLTVISTPRSMRQQAQ
jgi:hypothetical protein